MVGKVPPPKWAMILFLAILVLHTVIGSILILLQPDMGILFGELLTLLIPTVLVPLRICEQTFERHFACGFPAPRTFSSPSPSRSLWLSSMINSRI